MGTVRFEREGAIAWIILDNQSKLNAINAEMGRQLDDAYREIDSNPEIRVAVIAGAGEKAFSTGGEMSSYVSDGALGSTGSGPGLLPMPDTLTKPIIAAIRGYCLAGGFGLALSCDLRIVGKGAKLGPSGLKRGVVSGNQQTERLVKLVPFGKALEILLMSRYLGAEEAAELGLVQRIVEPESVIDAAREWAKVIAGFSPRAVRDTKKLAYECLTMEWQASFAHGREAITRSFQTEDAMEGFKAFLEKREPQFTGR